MSPPQYYKVWKLKFRLAVQDPDMPEERFHHILFVETKANGSGTKFHVTGNITSGIRYDLRPYHNPKLSSTLHTQEFLGYTNAKTVPTQWDAVLSREQPPPKQKAFNIKTMKTEPVKAWDP
ncbi:hypothetical protein F4677DRAFT_428009 [Hypoxylon crocopeplum]|nr:hypothetical protein F4677DRAFT_428009 [Hypoxylon crocopeplum]